MTDDKVPVEQVTGWTVKGIQSQEVGTVPTVALVEDSVADVQITERALQLAGARVNLVVLRDGEEAIRYFSAMAEKVNGSPPDCPDTTETPCEVRLAVPAFTLLDLNLPRISGFEVLDYVRSTSAICGLPIIVLSTSSHPDDIERAYRMGATTYFEKPHELQDFVDLLQVLQRYWLQFARTPYSRN